ncbi:hypothetical protein K504DRAFT_481429, partial [Pleomassaria siparia CBS 279.74]
MKRNPSGQVVGRPPKRARHASLNQSVPATTPHVQHPVLQRLYPHVVSLRHYLLSRLPIASKNRRRKLSQLGKPDATAPATSNLLTSLTRGVGVDVDIDTNIDINIDIDIELGRLLDSTLVGLSTTSPTASPDKSKHGDIVNFSQQLLKSSTGGTFKPGYFQQSETVDFVIWRLFKRSASYRPSHLLCHGFQRGGSGHGQHGVKTNAVPGIPGIASHYKNSYVEMLKGPLWCRLHAVLGEGGDHIMMDLLLDCSVFNCVQGRPSNYYQLSGICISLKCTFSPWLTTPGVPISEIKHEPAEKSEQRMPNTAGTSKQNQAALSSENRK